MKRVFLIPNAITAFGLTCGLFAIFRTSIADPTRDLFSLLQASAILILIAAVADLADGAIARLIRAESEFGGHFDSLADAVTFGVAPPLIVLKSITTGGEGPGRLLTFCVIIAAMIFSLCGVLRLVRFNVQATKKRNLPLDTSTPKIKNFTGLPIPAAASAAASASLMLIAPYFEIAPVTRAIVLALILVVLGYFMISRWKFPSVKALHFRVPSFYLVVVMGILAVLVLYGILEYFAIAFFAVSWFYLLVSCVLSLIRLLAGKRSKTLEDFEPDSDEEGES